MVDKSPEAFRTISEVGADLDIPQHVLRFWETRFSQIRPLKRTGGRRYYRPDDVDLIKAIRNLLYGQGYTIRGVQRILKEQGVKAVVGRAHHSAVDNADDITRDGAIGLLPHDMSGLGLIDGYSVADLVHDSDGDPMDRQKDHITMNLLKTALFDLTDGMNLLRQALGEQD